MTPEMNDVDLILDRVVEEDLDFRQFLFARIEEDQDLQDKLSAILGDYIKVHGW